MIVFQSVLGRNINCYTIIALCRMPDLSCAVVTIATSKSTEDVRSKIQKIWGSLLKLWSAFCALQIYNFHPVQTLNYTQGRHLTCEEALEQVAQRGVLLWRYSNPCFSTGVRWPSEVPSNPHHSVILWNKNFRQFWFYPQLYSLIFGEPLSSWSSQQLCLQCATEHSMASPALALIPSLPNRNLQQDHHHGLKLELQGTLRSGLLLWGRRQCVPHDGISTAWG